MKALTWKGGLPVRAGLSVSAPSGSSAALELRFLDFITLGCFFLTIPVISALGMEGWEN